MDSVLKGLFGGGEFESDENVNKAKDFINRYEEGDPSEGYSRDEALEYFQRATKGADQDQINRATQRAVEKLSPAQREDFAKMMQDRMSGQVDRQVPQGGGGDSLTDMLGGGGIGSILGSLLGGGMPETTTASTGTTNQGGGGFDIGDIIGSPMGKAVIAGVGAYVMKEMLDKR
jgi:hypothetical protein